MHFPITFVIKTKASKEDILQELKTYINKRSNGMIVIKQRYDDKAIEEIITINELYLWIEEIKKIKILTILLEY